jgi:uncharacterized protein (TIGR02757 family)
MNIKETLYHYADIYETKDFLTSDPSWFMHQVCGNENQETLAFIASCLSYGNRKQFFPKIQYILDCSSHQVYEWVASGKFERDIPDDDNCYYRLFTNHAMNKFLHALKDLIAENESIGQYVSHHSSDGFSAITAICNYFSNKGIEAVVPKDTTSACKRVCMFLRWMVRDNSPVDLGLWSQFIDKRSLIMPLDTHVMHEAVYLGLSDCKSPSMAAAKKLTSKLSKYFPDDPLKGDFALFGYGVNH